MKEDSLLSHRRRLFKKSTPDTKVIYRRMTQAFYVTYAIDESFQIFAVRGTIIRLHVKHIQLGYLARICNIHVNTPSRDISFFFPFLPFFSHFFLQFTFCVLPLHIRFFFSFSVITSLLYVCFIYFSHLFLEVLIPNSVCISCFYHVAQG